jgi:hypothetical protein
MSTKLKYMIKKLFIFAGLVLMLQACYYDKEEILNLGVSCDTTNVTFAGSVKPIFNSNCISCHDKFNNYIDIVQDSTEIINRINGIGDIMPQSGKMSSCNIRQIVIWIRNGGLNN